MSHHNEVTFCATCGHRTDASGICTYERQANFARFLSDVADRVHEKLAEKRATLQAVPDPIASYPDSGAIPPEKGAYTSCPFCGNSVDFNGRCLGNRCDGTLNREQIAMNKVPIVFEPES